MTSKKATKKSVKNAVKKVIKKTATKKVVKKTTAASPRTVKKSTKISEKPTKKTTATTKKATKKIEPIKSKVSKKTTAIKSDSKVNTKKAIEKKADKSTIISKKTATAKSSLPKDSSKPEQKSSPKAIPMVPSDPVATNNVPQPTKSEQPPQLSSDNHEYWQDNYQEDRLVLLIRDPYWCFAYWDLAAENQSTIIKSIQNDQAKLLIRTYDVTDINFDGTNAHRFEDLEISEEASNWYVNVWEADRAYCADLGILFPDGTFKTVLRSNIVTTPRDSISPIVDEEWMVVDEMFDQLYQSAGAGDKGRSSEAITKYMLKRVRADVTSGGLASMGSEGGRPKPTKNEDFWLVVHTELIVYGATEPNAKLYIQGQPMTLNSDGTFSVRFALPEGSQRIGVRAVNEADTEERSITPIVEKRTE